MELSSLHMVPLPCPSGSAPPFSSTGGQYAGPRVCAHLSQCPLPEDLCPAPCVQLHPVLGKWHMGAACGGHRHNALLRTTPPPSSKTPKSGKRAHAVHTPGTVRHRTVCAPLPRCQLRDCLSFCGAGLGTQPLSTCWARMLPPAISLS